MQWTPCPACIFPCRFLRLHAERSLLSVTREKQAVSRHGLPLCSSPVSPSVPSIRRWERQGRMCCQENPPRGPPWRQHSLSLPGRARTAAEPSLLQSKWQSVQPASVRSRSRARTRAAPGAAWKFLSGERKQKPVACVASKYMPSLWLGLKNHPEEW